MFWVSLHFPASGLFLKLWKTQLECRQHRGANTSWVQPSTNGGCGTWIKGPASIFRGIVLKWLLPCSSAWFLRESPVDWTPVAHWDKQISKPTFCWFFFIPCLTLPSLFSATWHHLPTELPAPKSLSWDFFGGETHSRVLHGWNFSARHFRSSDL